MARSAHIDSLPLLKDLRASIIKFADTARVALGEADSDIHRTMSWLTGQAQPHWQAQVRRCSQTLAQAKEQLRQKMLYKSADGGRPSVVDEKMAVSAAQRRLEEAQAKLKQVERWKRQLEQEVLQYRGQVQAVQRTVENDLPRAVGLLDRVMDNLDAYVAVTAPRAADDDRAPDDTESVARPTGLAGDAQRPVPPDEDDQEDENDDQQEQPT